jgi:hypothetical protein
VAAVERRNSLELIVLDQNDGDFAPFQRVTKRLFVGDR